VDGRIQNDAWYYGFAWTGSTFHYAGGLDGFKQATMDLGSPTSFSRAGATPRRRSANWSRSRATSP
jgi:hypothetical protein